MRGSQRRRDEDDRVEGGVGLSVAAAVEPATLGLAGGGFDRADAAERGEGGLAVEALGVVAGGDEQRGGGVGADAVTLQQLRGVGCDQRAVIWLLSSSISLVSVEDAAGEQAQGEGGRGGWRRGGVRRRAVGAAADQAGVAQAGQATRAGRDRRRRVRP